MIFSKGVELRPVVGLTRGLPPPTWKVSPSTAIRTHRRLVEKADELFQALPERYRSGELTGGPQHLRYIAASVEMHAQMSAVSTLISILGYIPKVTVN
ncbi:transcriptional repressor TraM [Agrobacterium vitis]